MTGMILHVDADAFYASVAQRDDPQLRGRPVAVGSWVVMAASYEARARGVRGGMPTSRARRLCPELLVARTDFDAYVVASRAMFEVFRRHASDVQAGSMEEAFLHGAASVERAEDVALTVRREVREAVDLPVSVGAGRTKVLAKLASRKAKPDGVFVVEPAEELAFLHALPVDRVWGVGPATAGKLHAHGLRLVGEAAELSEAQLMAILGKAAGRYVHAVANAREPPAVQRRRGRRSFGAQRALGTGPHTPEELDAAIAALAERLAQRMGKRERAGRTIVLRLRFRDYTVATRSRTLGAPTARAEGIAAAARELLAAALPTVRARGVTLVGLTVTNLADAAAPAQLDLPLG
jgi:DNA polymerase-4